jgi:hypothetical protein
MVFGIADVVLKGRKVRKDFCFRMKFSRILLPGIGGKR